MPVFVVISVPYCKSRYGFSMYTPASYFFIQGNECHKMVVFLSFKQKIFPKHSIFNNTTLEGWKCSSSAPREKHMQTHIP
jgi:hypothetical protein